MFQQALYSRPENQLSPHYVSEIDSKRFRKLVRLFEDLEAGRLLDIGCSNGLFEVPLLQCGWECHGIELTEAASEARRRGLEVVRTDVEMGIPFKDGQFDVVLAADIIEHIYDTEFLLTECRRVLRDRGVMILTTPNLGSLFNRILLLAGAQPLKVQYNCDGPGHVRYYTSDVLLKQLDRTGFRIETFASDYLPIPIVTRSSLLRETILEKLGYVFPRLGNVFVVRLRAA